jgi:hypothetical protein
VLDDVWFPAAKAKTVLRLALEDPQVVGVEVGVREPSVVVNAQVEPLLRASVHDLSGGDIEGSSTEGTHYVAHAAAFRRT